MCLVLLTTLHCITQTRYFWVNFFLPKSAKECFCTIEHKECFVVWSTKECLCIFAVQWGTKEAQRQSPHALFQLQLLQPVTKMITFGTNIKYSWKWSPWGNTSNRFEKSHLRETSTGVESIYLTSNFDPESIDKVSRCLARYSPRAKANNAIPCNTVIFNTIQCNTVQYNATSYNTMQYHAIQWLSLIHISEPTRPY